MEEKKIYGFPIPIRPGLSRIGWIGAGVMGSAMAGRLLAAGFELDVYARTPSKAAKLLRGGARAAASPADAARSADVVFVIVGGPSDVRSVVLDRAGGALTSLPHGGAIVDLTSSSPDLAREIASAAHARGCFAVDAPISGGDTGAREGKLVIFAGGDEKVIEWLRPAMSTMGRTFFMGSSGAGQISKIGNQILVAANLVGFSEAMVFAERAGLERARFLDALKSGEAATKVSELFGDRILRQDFEPGAAVKYMVKDLGMAMEEEVVLQGAELARQMFEDMVANGDGESIHGVMKVVERINSVDRQSR